MQTLFLRRWQETKSKRTHTAFLKIFRVAGYTNKRIKNALSPYSNIFVVKYQSFTKCLIRWPVLNYIL